MKDKITSYFEIAKIHFYNLPTLCPVGLADRHLRKHWINTDLTPLAHSMFTICLNIRVPANFSSFPSLVQGLSPAWEGSFKEKEYYNSISVYLIKNMSLLTKFNL